MRVVVKYFGDRILSLLEKGIYSSVSYVRDLKINEYSSKLLSGPKETLFFNLMMYYRDSLLSFWTECRYGRGLANQNTEMHHKNRQFGQGPGSAARGSSGISAGAQQLCALRFWSQKNWDCSRLLNICIRGRTLIISLDNVKNFATIFQLAVNYNHQLNVHMQEILPKLCEYHDEDAFRDDTRNLFFQCVSKSLHSMYLKMDMCDFNTLGVPVHEKWPQTLLRLKTIVNVEIRKNSWARCKNALLSNNKFSDPFIKMSALAMYIVRRIS